MATVISLSRIHQISMRAHDVERAVRFYRDALGLPFLFAAPPRLAFFKTEPHKIATLADREVWLADFEDTGGNMLAPDP